MGKPDNQLANSWLKRAVGLQRALIQLRRWSAWARTLLLRHGRTVTDLRPSDMALVRPVPLVHRLHQQWFLAWRQYVPRIHLSIQPILRHTVLHDRAGVELPVINRLVEHRAISHLHNDAIRKQAPEDEAFDSGEFIDAAGSRSPLQLVYQRLRHADALTVTHRRNSAVYQTVETQTSEIRQRIQRVEKRFAERPSLTFHQLPQIPAIHVEANQSPVNGTPTSITPTAYGMQPSPWIAGSAPMPPLNMEHLADQVMRQIDRRMTAWRERRGRI